MFFGLFKKKEKIEIPPLLVDMHSHLLPNLDDGADDLEESVTMIKRFVDLGYKKLITTPHIMSDFYCNTPEGIREKQQLVNTELKKRGIDICLEIASEYYLDEGFLAKLDENEPLLTFGDNYILFETSYINEPPHLETAIFAMQSKGLKPVLAHPERYTYMYDDFSKVDKLVEQGVLLQVNINSLNGYYSKTAKKFAERMIDKKQVSFISSDCHKHKHLDVLEKVRSLPYYEKAIKNGLLNNQLL